MKKLIILMVLIAAPLFLSACAATQAEGEAARQSAPAEAKGAEKVEVVHFHATQQCRSCVTVGEYAQKTVKERFPLERANGTVVFREINGELPANREMVMKFQARGSALFLNAITDGADKIEEDIAVWRLIGNEKQFMDYLENKIRLLLK